MSIFRHTFIIHLSLSVSSPLSRHSFLGGTLMQYAPQAWSTAYSLHSIIIYLVSRVWTTACAVATMLANYRHTVSFPCGFGSYSRLPILFAADYFDVFFYFPFYLNFPYDTRVTTQYLYVRASGSIARQDNVVSRSIRSQSFFI